MTPFNRNVHRVIRPGPIFGLLVAGALCLEIALRVFPVYRPVLEKSVSRMTADLAVHRRSDNSEIVYELKPSSSLVVTQKARPDGDTAAGKRSVNVNSLGFRGPEYSAQKPDGVFRIIVFGDSNTYGRAVNDSQTYPAALERLLNSSAPGRFEVWNAGLCESVLSQKAERAFACARDYSPDLLVFQMRATGRRAFLPGQDLLGYLEVNPRLMAENIPCAFSRRYSLSRTHSRLLMRCHIYRALNVWLNALSGKARRVRLATVVGQRNSCFLFEHFSSLFSDIPIVFFDPSGTFSDSGAYAGIECIRFDLADKPAEFRVLCPPAHVYDWYAEVLARELRKKGLIPA